MKCCPPPSRKKVYRAKIPPAPSVPVPRPSAANRRPQGQIGKTGPERRDRKIQSNQNPGIRGDRGRPTSSRKTQAVPISQSKTSPQTASSPTGLQPRRKAAARKITRATAPATKVKSRIQTKPKVTYDRFDDADLTLQALAWADDAARRMVVINGQIVHEGESVDGYQILKIRENDVIVNQGGKSWRLEFGLQQ